MPIVNQSPVAGLNVLESVYSPAVHMTLIFHINIKLTHPSFREDSTKMSQIGLIERFCGQKYGLLTNLVILLDSQNRTCWINGPLS